MFLLCLSGGIATATRISTLEYIYSNLFFITVFSAFSIYWLWASLGLLDKKRQK